MGSTGTGRRRLAAKKVAWMGPGAVL